MKLKQVQESSPLVRALPLTQEAETAAERGYVVPMVRRQKQRPAKPLFLSRTQKRVAVGVPIAYGGCLCLLNLATGLGWNAVISSCFEFSITLGPCLLCLWLGAHLRYKRLGALAGAGVGFMGLVGLMLHTFDMRVFSPQNLIGLLVWLTIGAVLGTIGAALGQWLRGRPIYVESDSNR